MQTKKTKYNCDYFKCTCLVHDTSSHALKTQDYIVCEIEYDEPNDGECDSDDDCIFFYGVTEDKLKELIAKKEPLVDDYYVTAYRKINYKQAIGEQIVPDYTVEDQELTDAMWDAVENADADDLATMAEIILGIKCHAVAGQYLVSLTEYYQGALDGCLKPIKKE